MFRRTESSLEIFVHARTLSSTEALSDSFDATETDEIFGGDSFANQMRQVARIIRLARERGTERLGFYVRKGNFDSHNSMTSLQDNFLTINDALVSFVAEMKNLGVWNDVLIITQSDFGRTLTE